MHDITAVIRQINEMEAAGVIKHYAIGGAVAATFYLEPLATLDVDVFISFDSGPAGTLISLSRPLEYLRERGCTMTGEYVVIGGWPVQFLPPTGPLVEEALERRVTIDVDGTPAQVFRPEHLAAIALQVGRAKDKARLLQFLEEGAVDRKEFEAILERHSLSDRWRTFASQFLGES